MRNVFGSVFYTFLLFFMQLESSSETRSALENQLERLTRDKVCVGQFCLFILSMFAVPKSCFLFVFDNGFNFFMSGRPHG